MLPVGGNVVIDAFVGELNNNKSNKVPQATLKDTILTVTYGAETKTIVLDHEQKGILGTTMDDNA